MPNCFTLRKHDAQELSNFTEIDEAICAHFGWPVDPVKYAYWWYDIIGLRLACGQGWDEIIAAVSDEEFPELGNIARWLKENYTSDAWHQRHK
jgi:hypothetical protein